MNFVIRFAGLVGVHTGPGATPGPGSYLSGADIEAHGGRGEVTWTTDWRRAMLFGTSMEAFMFWRQQSRTRPKRNDGQPNRPLTAFSIEIVALSRAVNEPHGVMGPDVTRN